MLRKKFSQALEKIRMSPIVSISEMAREKSVEFEKRGEKFLHFQRGEIDFPTPSYIIEAAKEGLKKGLTKYPKSGGEEWFKEAILEKLADENQARGLSKENITCTYGGQEALEIAFKLFEGQRGAGFSPCWSPVFENFVPYAKMDFREISFEEDFSVNFSRLEKVLKEVDFLYVNSPHNPTGKVFSGDELIRIAKVCKKHDVYVISDEAYEKIVYDGKKHFSLASLPFEHIISAFSFSKTYSMTGWRLGYTVTRNKRINEIFRLADYTQTAGVVTFLQHAGKVALENREEGEKSIETMVLEFQKRRDILYQGLKSIKGLKVQKPEGAFYMFPNFTDFIPKKLKGLERQRYIFNLLLDQGIAAVYGSCFGQYSDDNVRLSFSATPIPLIEIAVERLRRIFSDGKHLSPPENEKASGCAVKKAV